MLANFINKLRLSSIRTRYALAALVLALGLFVVTTSSSRFVNNVRQQTSSHILQRKHFLQQARHVRDSIRAIEKSLQSFLLDPHIQNSVPRLESSVNAGLSATQKLQHEQWVNSLGQHENLKKFYGSLQLLDTSLTNLVETRLNPRKQYPAMIYARDTMLPYNIQLVSAIDLALDELHEQKTLDGETEIKLLNIRHLWTQMISNFRMYLANRLGSFDEKNLPIQQREIEVTLDAIQKLINELRKQAEAGKLGLQTTISIQQADSLLKQWQTDFAKVVKIHASDKWRADVYMLRTDRKSVV